MNLKNTIDEATIKNSMNATRAAELMKENRLEELSKDFIPPKTFRYMKNLYSYTGVEYPHFYLYRLVKDKNDEISVCSMCFTKFEILEAMGLLPDTYENPNRY